MTVPELEDIVIEIATTSREAGIRCALEIGAKASLLVKVPDEAQVKAVVLIRQRDLISKMVNVKYLYGARREEIPLNAEAILEAIT